MPKIYSPSASNIDFISVNPVSSSARARLPEKKIIADSSQKQRVLDILSRNMQSVSKKVKVSAPDFFIDLSNVSAQSNALNQENNLTKIQKHELTTCALTLTNPRQVQVWSTEQKNGSLGLNLKLSESDAKEFWTILGLKYPENLEKK